MMTKAEEQLKTLETLRSVRVDANVRHGDLMMQKMKLVVEVRARLDWIEPPKDANEAAMREYANNMAEKAGHQLIPAVQLLVAELLNAQAPNAELTGRRRLAGDCPG